jgi:MoaD family protein
MKITVRYLAQAREAAGRAVEEIELDGPTTVHDLIVRLARQHGSAFSRMALDGAGCPHPSLLVVIGDDQVRSGEARKLGPGDTITLMTPISGG